MVLAALIGLGALKLPIEHNLAVLYRQEHFHGVKFNLDLREKLGQLGFVAALSGFRAIVAGRPFIRVFGMGKHRMGSNAIIVPANHNAPTTSASVLGHGGLAYGLERERGRDE